MAVTAGYGNTNVIEGTEDFIQVVTVDEGGGYDWHEMVVWYSPKADRFFWYAESGCSCNSFLDYPVTLSEFGDGDRKAAIEAIKSEYGSYARSESDAAIETLRTWAVTA